MEKWTDCVLPCPSLCTFEVMHVLCKTCSDAILDQGRTTLFMFYRSSIASTVRYNSPPPPPHLRNLGIGKVHLRMLLLELLQHINLPLLVGSRQSHCLLSLIEHHLLHSLPRFPIQIVELGVFRLDAGNVDCSIPVAYAIPPFHLIQLLQIDDETRSVLHGPEGIVAYDRFGQWSINDVSPPGGRDVRLQPDLEMLPGHDHGEIPTPSWLMQRNVDGNLLQGLSPHVLTVHGTAIAHWW
mmetsp:Transcript_7613/g.16707  ORF Transcript_7613/g.16707 Transcript_7613/m.16707 type:complete len:239 (-) Transcript_7613:576-1292(-)